MSLTLLEKKVLLDSVELESRKTIPAFRKLILLLREGMGLETGITTTKVCNKNRGKKRVMGHEWALQARLCKRSEARGLLSKLYARIMLTFFFPFISNF